MERFHTPHVIPARDGHRPIAVVVHTVVGSFDSCLRWFAAPQSGVSTHYVVGLDGRLAQLVDEADGARHCTGLSGALPPLFGDVHPALLSVGIEFEDGGDPAGVERTAIQYGVGAALIAGIAERWEIPLDREHVVGHRELGAKRSCPGNLDVDRLVREAVRISGARAGQR